MGVIEVLPLATVTRDQLEDVRSERWCWTPAHMQEELATFRHRVSMDIQPFGNRITHLHRHGMPCNESCVLQSYQPEPGDS